MKYSGIGGQAVLEGIMMKNGTDYAVAVRKEDGSIAVKKGTHTGLMDKLRIARVPFIRGIFAFLDSMILGISALNFSASFEEEKKEEGEAAEEKEGKEKKESGGLSKGETAISLILAVVIAVGIFVLLPALVTSFLKRWIESAALRALIEGVFRLLLFIGYILLISLMPDIRRTFMYHGSEHKCINCVEHGLPLTVENVMKSSKEHKRCGTSFILIVLLISIILFMFIRIEYLPLKLLSRLLLIPVIAGISYELLRFTGRHDNLFVKIISRPGMWMQALTTKEPEPEMAEVAIRAVEEVFDWRKYLKDNFPEENPEL